MDGGLLVVEGVLHAVVAVGLLVDHGVGTGEVHDLTGDVIPEVIHFFQAVGVILGAGLLALEILNSENSETLNQANQNRAGFMVRLWGA